MSEPVVRIVVNSAGRFVSVAYSDHVLATGERAIEVTQTEYDRLLADDFQWVNNRDQLTDPSQIATALQRNHDFLANAAPTQAEVLAHVRFLSRVVERLVRITLSGTNPALLNDVSAI